ncbi:septal ring lytic transglycosylase RlpA family protein [Zhongshania aliphaticivorans]|uniref:septal ring lytic transglycosylase RlpA family protein n=1 Tax=Zhongshania aliphaticivorans TaxID=1470434 RepID=UPI00257362D9|nr:septal ring lytic transglycosylase RlpA family protein [Zhongshania aliphaticivorans]
MSKILTYRFRRRAANSCIALITIAILFSLAGCSSVPLNEDTIEEAPAPVTTEAPTAVMESGLASFYDDKYHNRTTASGERYRHELYTAAHRTLVFGSRVKVTNKKTGASVVVTINDRGPFIRGRVIDLSKVAFAEIGNISSGLIKVDIELIE